MADRFTKSERSRVMRSVPSRDTSAEIKVRKIIHAAGYRFRLNRADLPGKPDIVLPRMRTVVFVHGCFWHGHQGCRRASLPASNRDYWAAKIGRNVARDKRVARQLRKAGWHVLTVWECALRDIERCNRALTGRLERLDDDS